MWDKLERGQKLIAAIIGIGTIGGGISGGIVLMSKNAAASVVSPVERRVTLLEDQRTGEIEWRRYLVQRLDHIADTVGAPKGAPPEIAVNPPKESH